MVDKQPSGPHVFIQWKGTNACMDVYCDCGEQCHIDDSFAYFYECKCGRKYAMPNFLSMIPLTDAQANEHGYEFGLCWKYWAPDPDWDDNE